MNQINSANWRRIKIEEIGEVIGGGTPPTNNKEYWNNGSIPWITPKDLSDHKEVFIERGERNITEIGLQNSASRKLPEGTVLFTSRAPIGYVAIAKNEVTTNQGFKSIVCNPKIANNKFIYYSLKYNKDRIESIASGSTFKEVSGSTLKSFEILLPPLLEQFFIAKILFDLDSSFELLQDQNKTLEAIGQAIFKHWFIDFEFPNEEGKPYKSSGGDMIYNKELGKEIPKEWRVSKLNGCCKQITRGFTTDYVEKSNLINLNQKVNRGDYLDKSNYKYYPEDAEVPKEKFACRGDILINSLGQGTLGRVHLFWEESNNIVVDQHITIVRSDINRLFPEYLYFFLIYPFNQKRLENQITGSTGMLMLNISKIRNFEIIVPDIKIQKKFSQTLSKVYFKKALNIKEIEALSQIRDSLLPKLMSGKIRVPIEVK